MPKTQSAKDNHELAPAELEVLYALASGAQRWSTLRTWTRLSPRWLSKTLDKLEKERKALVRTQSLSKDSASSRVTYEFTPQFRTKNQNLVRIMAVLGRVSKVEMERSVNATPLQVVAMMTVYAQLTAVAKYFHEDALASFLKNHGIRIVEEWFEKYYDPAELRELLLKEHNKDLKKMTFAEYLKWVQFPELIAEYEHRYGEGRLDRPE
jgi:DNA-binding HxlR family transcriptional regulator